MSVSVKCQSVKCSGRAINIRIPGREDTSNEEGVDEMRKTIDTEILHRNNIRRRSTSARATRTTQDSLQSWIIWREDDANE